jgi:predicted ATPase
MTSWILGYPDTALLQIEKALKAAKAATSTVSLTNTVVFVAFVHAFRRDAKATCEHADAGIALSEQYGFPVFDAVLRVVRACTMATNVPDSSGRLLLEARQGIDRYRSAGMLAWLGMLLGLYSEAALGSGNVSEARTALDEAMDCISSTQEQFWIAELTRLEAELLIADDAPRFDEAETHLRSALDTARRQGARMLELRICTSLARLWRDLGRQEEARMLLAPVHEWFTEGSDCADLRESAELLDVLC